MDLKGKWEQMRRRRLSQTEILNFGHGDDFHKYKACTEYVRDTDSLKQLLDEIEESIQIHRENVTALHYRYLTTQTYRNQAEEFIRQRLPTEALHSLNEAIIVFPLALVTSNTCCTGSTTSDTCLSASEKVCRCSCATNADASQSLRSCSDPDDVAESYKLCVSECFALRGQLLLNRNQSKEAEADLSLCLSVHGCRPLRCAVYFLLGEARRQQGQLSIAREAYEKCHELLQKVEGPCCLLDLPSEDSILRILASFTSETDQESIKGANTSNLPSLAQGESDGLAYGSSLIKVNFTKEKGRFLEACGKIKAGDTLIVEPAFSSVLLPEYYNSHCYHCLDPITVPYPCMQCQHVRFCSLKCSNESWSQYHQVECKIWPLFGMVDALTHLSIRSLLVAKRDEIVDVLNMGQNSPKNRDRIPGFSASGVYQNDYRAVHSLVTNTDLQPEQALFSFSLTASIVTPFLSQAVGCIERDSKSVEDSCRELRNSIRKCRSSEYFPIDSRKHEILNVNSIAAAFSRSPSPGMSIRKQSRSLDETAFTQDSLSAYHVEKLQNRYCSCDSFQNSRLFTNNILDRGRDDKLAVESMPLTESQLGSLVLHHLQQMSCNVFAVTKLVTFQEVQSSAAQHTQSTRKELRRVAMALYPTSCLLNHSCDPDVIVSFTGKTMIVKATHNILPGEEITHCYGPHVGHMIRAARQKMLRNQYYFTCRCGACRRDEELEREQLCRLSLLCPECRGSLKVSFEGDDFIGSCGNPLCGNVSTVSKELQQFKETIDELTEALTIGREGDLRKSLSLLQAVLRKRSAILLSKDKYVGEVHDALARCFATLGDWSLASYHCSLNIEAIEYQYGSNSTELAHELHRFSQFLFRGKYTKKAVDVVERSIRLLSFHYGKDYPEVKDLLKIRLRMKDFSTPVTQLIL